MLSANVSRHAFRVFLLLHFLGLALSIGGRLADFVVEGVGDHASLQTLAWARGLSGTIARQLVAPGFWIMIVSGVVLTALRYGRRPPVWVWIKVTLNAFAILALSPFVAASLTAARRWATWSADHGHLAPEFTQSATRAAVFGAIVFTFVLLNIPVAIWKPFAKVRPRIGWRREAPTAA